jgi:hypothetical protein
MTLNTKLNGICPSCKKAFNPQKATIAFPGVIPGKKISLIFALCPSCYQSFKMGSNTVQIDIVKRSFINLVKTPPADLTVTTSLVLDAYSGDFFDAWVYGLDLPQFVFEAINDGLVDAIALLPSLEGVLNAKHS